MNEYQRKQLSQIVQSHALEKSPIELAIGFSRYEALRKLSSSKYRELCQRNYNGERFDDMVDELVISNSVTSNAQ